MKAMRTFTSLLLLCCAVKADESTPNICQNTVGSACGVGCWNSSDAVVYFDAVQDNGEHLCQPVGAGYYSPINDDNRYICQAGTFSDSETARVCDKCPAGSFSAVNGASSCQYCPRGSFSGVSESTDCNECDDSEYSGIGSDYAIPLVDGGPLHCVAPFFVPETNSMPTMAPIPSFEESAEPSRSPSASPTTPTQLPPSPTIIIQMPTTSPPSSQPSGPPVPPSSQPSGPPVTFSPTATSQPTSRVVPSLVPSSTPTVVVLSTSPTTVQPIKNEPTPRDRDEERLRATRRYLPLLVGLLVVVAAVWYYLQQRKRRLRQRPGPNANKNRTPPPPPPALPNPNTLPSSADSNEDVYLDEDAASIAAGSDDVWSVQPASAMADTEANDVESSLGENSSWGSTPKFEVDDVSNVNIEDASLPSF